MKITSLVLAIVIGGFCQSAQASGADSMVSNYYVAGSTQVSGWEQGLVARDRNLAQYHWHAITASVHARRVAGRTVAAAPYRNSKPMVMALPANSSIKTKAAKSDTQVSARLSASLAAPKVSAALSYAGSNYSTGCGLSLSENKVCGRVLNY